MNSGRVSRAVILAYALPGLAATLPVIPIAVLLPTWYARDLGLGFVATGIVLAGARLFDFATDPVVGVCSDRYAWRGLRYKTWVLGGAVLAAIGLALLAYPPPQPSPGYLAVGTVLLFSGWTAFMIPYTAWGAELADGHHERSLVTTAREGAGLCGMLLALGTPAWLTMRYGDAAPVPLVALVWLALLLGAPALWGLLRFVPEPSRALPSARIRAGDLLELARLPACRHTLLCWLINGIANGLPAVLFPLVVSDYLELDEQALYTLLVVYFGAAIVALPLWLIAAREWGKVSAWRVAIAINMLVFAQVLWITPATAAWFVVVCVVSGATLGADLALPPSLQADVMENDRAEAGRRRTATAFALWSMATKLSLAVAVGIAFVGIGAGRDDSLPVDAARLLAAYVVLPLVLKTVVFYLLRAVALSGAAQTASEPAHRRANERQEFV